MSDAKARLKGIVEQLREYMEWQAKGDAMDVLPASEEARQVQRDRLKARRQARMERLQSSFRSGREEDSREEATEQRSRREDGPREDGAPDAGGRSRYQAESPGEKAAAEGPKKKEGEEESPWSDLGELRTGSKKKKKQKSNAGGESSSGQGRGGGRQSSGQRGSSQQGPPRQGPPPPQQGPPPDYRPGPPPEQQQANRSSGGGGASGGDKPQSNEEKLDWLRDYMGDCQRCPLGQNRQNLVFGEGNPEARLVFVGEAPGKNEDETGRPFVGPAGELLTKMIGAMGLERQEVYICNVLKSRPPRNRDPRPDEIRECIPFLKKQLAIIEPEVIVTLGRPASQQLLQTDQALGRMRGRWHSYGESAVMPTYHPAYLLHNESRNNKRKVWSDLQQVIDRLGLPGPNA